MRTRVELKYTFEAAHVLPNVPPGHPCGRLHGHSYTVELSLDGELDPKMGWIMDFADIDVHAKPLIEALDHRTLNDIDGLANPTSEHLAQWLWQRLAPRLPGLCEVAVAETARSRCVVSRA